MDIKDLKSVIKMITDTDITEFELELPEQTIRIKRGSNQEIIHIAAPQHSAPVHYAAPAHAPSPVVAPQVAVVAEAAEKGTAVTSPIVGTFYRAPAPDAPPYAEVGQVVEKGQVLCIVEAMKLMNEIEAEYRCKIVKICKENAQPVEFGDPLFIVEPL